MSSARCAARHITDCSTSPPPWWKAHMATDVPMPKLGLTMEEGTILEWLVPDGAHVEADAPIMLIETDKTETEVGAPGTGRLHQLGRPGETFGCGVRVAVLLDDGEVVPAAPAERRPPPAAGT